MTIKTSIPRGHQALWRHYIEAMQDGRNEAPSLETSRFSLYFAGSCIAINPKLSHNRNAPILFESCQTRILNMPEPTWSLLKIKAMS
jgi:hypothetical protein